MECDCKLIVHSTMMASSASVLYLMRSNPYIAPLMAISLLAAMWKSNRRIKEWVIAPLLIPVVALYWWRFEFSQSLK